MAGTQASESHFNKVIVMKLSNLHRTAKNEGSDNEEDDEESDDEQQANGPKMLGALIKHQGGVNRIRVKFQFLLPNFVLI